jgi:hypothetical protein
MIIHDFHVMRISFMEAETDSILIVHPDAVLSGASALQGFQTITRWNPQVPQIRREMKHQKLARCGLFSLTSQKTRGFAGYEKLLRPLACKGYYHA